MSPNVVIVVVLAAMVLFIAVVVCLCTLWWRHSLRAGYHNDRFQRTRTGQRETTVKKTELAERSAKRNWKEGGRTPAQPSRQKTPAPPRRPPPPPTPPPPPRPLPPAHGGNSIRHDNQPSRQEWPSVPPARSNKPPTPEEWSPAPPSRGSKRTPSKHGTPAAPTPAAKVPTKPPSQDDWEAVPQAQPPSKAASDKEWELPPDPPFVASGGVKRGSKKSWQAESKPASNRGGAYDTQGFQQQQQHGGVDPNALTAALQQANEETHEEPAEPEGGW